PAPRAPARHRPERQGRSGGRGAPRIRGDRLVTMELRRSTPPPVGQGRRPRVLIIIQNLAVPFDRRVWLECQALRDAGYDVHVVCPKGPGDPTHEVVSGVTLHKYRPSPVVRGPLGYVVEYSWSLALTAWLTARAFRRRRFD